MAGKGLSFGGSGQASPLFDRLIAALDAQRATAMAQPGPVAGASRNFGGVRPDGVEAARAALAYQEPGWAYGSVLPFRSRGDQLQPAIPGFLRDLGVGSLDLLLGTKTGAMTPEASMALAGLMMGGTKPTGALGAGALERAGGKASVAAIRNQLKAQGWIEGHASKAPTGGVRSAYLSPPGDLMGRGEIRISDHELGTKNGEPQGLQWPTNIVIDPNLSLADHMTAIHNENYRDGNGFYQGYSYDEWLKDQSAAPKGIRAFHGSPHIFDEFKFPAKGREPAIFATNSKEEAAGFGTNLYKLGINQKNMQSVHWRDFQPDDPIYTPDTMEKILQSRDPSADVMEIRGVQNFEHGPKSTTYAIFDPHIIEILRKYGLGPMVAGPAAAAGLAFGQQGQQ